MTQPTLPPDDALALEAAPAEVALKADQVVELAIREEIRRGGNWFYWLSGLALINDALAPLSLDMPPLFGLAASSLLGFLGQNLGPAWDLMCQSVAIGLMMFFVVMGYFASQGWRWAFMLGMIVYIVDMCLALHFGYWPMLLVHAVVFYQLGRGLAACFS